MKIYIVIPVHNEEVYIKDCLTSLANQSLLPEKIVVVDDNSTDNTAKIVKSLTKEFLFLKLIHKTSSNQHLPGKKVIRAFNYGLDTLDDGYDVICKFDGDLIFPKKYLETIALHFKSDSKIGMVSGHCYIQKNNAWIYENIASKSHTRGPIKAYKKACFKAIGGLKISVGWDSVDELIALYFDWKFYTDHRLLVKHLKPTGSNYDPKTAKLQGKALYKMRSGFAIALLSAIKMAFNKKQLVVLFNYINGYLSAWKTKSQYIVTESQGKFMRRYRWKAMWKKIIRI